MWTKLIIVTVGLPIVGAAVTYIGLTMVLMGYQAGECLYAAALNRRSDDPA
jgi:hypothetical protein